jgi:hypothetical protein
VPDQVGYPVNCQNAEGAAQKTPESVPHRHRRTGALDRSLAAPWKALQASANGQVPSQEDGYASSCQKLDSVTLADLPVEMTRRPDRSDCHGLPSASPRTAVPKGACPGKTDH